MRIVSSRDWPGTLAELQARVAALLAARIAHAQTVEQPSPRDIPLVEELADRGEEFTIFVEPPPPEPPPPPTPEQLADIARRQEFKDAIDNDPTMTALKTITKDQFDAWWTANVTNAAQAIAVLHKLTWLTIKNLR